MSHSSRFRGRFVALLAALLTALGVLAVVPVQATPGVPPDITSTNTATVDPDTSTYIRINATGVDSPATVTFTGTGVTGSVVTYGADRIRIEVVVDATAEAGLRDMTITNPDGLSDTMVDAIEVTGDIPPPATGDLTGHVFDDTNGNGVLDGGEQGLEGASVDVIDSMGNTHGVATDANGDFTVLSIPTGDANLSYTPPPGYALTTGNDAQTVTIVADTTVVAADVGYESVPTGTIAGRVFTDVDGNGVEDGGDTGWAGADVSIEDADGTTHDLMTDSNGDYSIAGLPLGNATVTYATPSGATLTTGNDVQTITVADGVTADADPVGYEPPAGVAPDIQSIQGSSTIDPGASKYMKVSVTNYQDGGTFTVSGAGVTADVVRFGGDLVRILVTADAGAEAGLRDLTVTNPDGLSDTLADAITVTGDNPPPDSGTVAGHVFQDLDGNGVEDGADSGFAGVAVSFVDEGGTTTNSSTDGNGDFSMDVGVGDGTLTVSLPAGYVLTTGNATQALTIVVDTTTNADAVGYTAAGLTYQDVAGIAGLTLSHSAGGECVPPIGIGAAWADVDNDGDQDLYTSDRAGNNHLYINEGDTSGDGTPDFTDMAASLGIDHAGLDSWAVAFADVDNDGDQDLYVSDETGNVLWENQFANNGGTLAFVDVTAAAGAGDDGRAETITFGDFDRDGWLDFYIAKHMHCGGTNTDRLFHGDGDGTFTDWTTYLCDEGDPATCDDVNGLGFAAAFLDVDQDGDDDIYVVNDNIDGVNQPNKMFRNDGSNGSGGWTFTEVGQTDGSGLSVNGMGLGWGDYNNDGWLDLAFSDAAPGHLLENDGDGTYTDVSVSSDVQAETSGAIGWGTAFYDYNNDGWQDLLFAHGGIHDVSQDYPNALLENDKDDTFTNVSAATGMDDVRRGRGIALADFNDDGWVDVFLSNYDDAPILMQNMSAENGATNGYLTVTVEGTESNRDGLGTEVVLTTSAGTQRQVITSGPNHGGGTQKAAFFGMGGDATATLMVYWPNGQVQDLGSVGADQALHLVEPVTPPPADGLFEDVTTDAGIVFSHVSPGCGPPIGVGAAWADIDNDGDQDLYVTNPSGANHMYRNDGDTSGDGIVDFTNIAATLGIEAAGVRSFATVFVDLDNDGDQDLFVGSDSGNMLYRNDLIETTTLGFTDVTASSGLTDLGRVETATFGDLDNDGFLDLYVAKHGTCASFGDTTDHLYHNTGGLTFADWNTELCSGATTCADVEGLGFAAGMFDYDEDGDLDIYLVNDDIAGSNQPNKFWRNDGSDGGGGWVFTEVGATNGSGVSVNGMGLGIGDPDNDGLFDVAYSDAAPGHMLNNNGDGSWTDVSGTSGISAETAGDVGWGTVFFDYNNDGWEDLFFAVGTIHAIAPLANSLLENNRDGTFTNVSASTNMDDTARGRGTAIADMDGDGWVDMYIGNYDADPLLMRNRSGDEGNPNHYLTFTVEGTDSNRDGIGTIIKATTPDGTMMRLISSGSNHGGGSQKAAFFGLGSHTSASIEVIWPNGEVETLGSMTADAAYHLVEPTA